MRLLLVEDDELLGNGLLHFLQAEGHRVDWCRRLLEARLALTEPYDALLVDWRLPDGSGVDWVRSLRQQHQTVAVLILTARDGLRDRIEGLDAGADDYLVKPFEPEELTARLRAVLRRQAGQSAALLEIGRMRCDIHARTAWVDEAPVALTLREWQLLEALALRRGRWVDKDALGSLLPSADGVVAHNAIEAHISSLRRKLGPAVVETARGLGYRMPP